MSLETFIQYLSAVGVTCLIKTKKFKNNSLNYKYIDCIKDGLSFEVRKSDDFFVFSMDWYSHNVRYHLNQMLNFDQLLLRTEYLSYWLENFLSQREKTINKEKLFT